MRGVGTSEIESTFVVHAHRGSGLHLQPLNCSTKFPMLAVKPLLQREGDPCGSLIQ